MNLQYFADTVYTGKDLIYLYRILSESKTAEGLSLAYTTENTRSESRDSDTVSTKSGVIRVPKDLETTIKATALFSSANDAIVSKLEAAIRNDTPALVELWEVNLAHPGITPNAEKYEATYFQAYVSSMELTSNSEDHAEYAIEFGITGVGQTGWASVTDEQKAISQYVFKDTIMIS